MAALIVFPTKDGCGHNIRVKKKGIPVTMMYRAVSERVNTPTCTVNRKARSIGTIQQWRCLQSWGDVVASFFNGGVERPRETTESCLRSLSLDVEIVWLSGWVE